MKNIIIKLLSVLIVLGTSCNNFEKNNKFDSNWESLKQYRVPEWWKNTKFGIYFHLGPYSVPAYKSEWYSHWMYEKSDSIRKYHENKYGDLKFFGYKDFIPFFKATKFNADSLSILFKKAGAQFAGLVAEHADGFAMWNSKLTKWNAYNMGPRMDIVGLMEKAIKKNGMKFIVTYHRHWLYAWYPTWDKTTDAGDSLFSGLYGPYSPEGAFEMAVDTPQYLPDDNFNKEWLNRLYELIDNYNPDIIYFDNKMNIIDEKYRMEFLSYFYNKAKSLNKEVVCTYKFNDLAEGTAILDLERSRMNELKKFNWLTDDSVDWDSWCNVVNPNYKSTNRIIDFMIDVVSKNGAVLLNVTPTSEGEIPIEVKKKLLEIGNWLEINGEAIYNTRPWYIYGEGPLNIKEGHLSESKNNDATSEDIRFTCGNGQLYAIALDWPTSGIMKIKTLKKRNEYIKDIKNISLLGSDKKIEFKQTDKELIIILPDCKPCDYAYTLKIN